MGRMSITRNPWKVESTLLGAILLPAMVLAGIAVKELLEEIKNNVKER